jgi:hypothetical protein
MSTAYIEEYIVYGYICIIVISIIIKFILKNNICLLSNNKLCREPETTVLPNGKTGYSCENAKLYKPVILSSLFKFIRTIMYVVLICAILYSTFVLFVNNNIINDASGNQIVLLLAGYSILVLQLFIWFVMTTFCKGNNYKCNVDFNVISDQDLIEYKYINVNCVNNVSQSRVINWFITYYKLFDNAMFYVIIILALYLIYVSINSWLKLFK